jgi:hypothetical protein
VESRRLTAWAMARPTTAVILELQGWGCIVCGGQVALPAIA